MIVHPFIILWRSVVGSLGLVATLISWCLCLLPGSFATPGKLGSWGDEQKGAVGSAMVALFLGRVGMIHSNGSGKWWKIMENFMNRQLLYWRGPCLLPWLLGRRVSIVASWIDVARWTNTNAHIRYNYIISLWMNDFYVKMPRWPFPNDLYERTIAMTPWEELVTCT